MHTLKIAWAKFVTEKTETVSLSEIVSGLLFARDANLYLRTDNAAVSLATGKDANFAPDAQVTPVSAVVAVNAEYPRF